MKSISTNILVIFLGALLFISCSKEEDVNELPLNEPIQDGSGDKDNDSVTYNYTKIETETIALVNTYRVSLGLAALDKIAIMSVEAESHVAYMIEAEKISHDNFSDRAHYLIENIPAKSVGENVAAGYRDAETVVDAWLKSSEHRSVIEDASFTHTGISIKTNAVGTKYFVQIFALK
ncbi:MAG: hypothetical protein COB81_07925 [Flavobacteriaceae bacterium]|nr:MAG: hypothetical protein COB81_07925 [Flavobacteriaceae bacterium]